jgi:hypothetical protein
LDDSPPATARIFANIGIESFFVCNNAKTTSADTEASYAGQKDCIRHGNSNTKGREESKERQLIYAGGGRLTKVKLGLLIGAEARNPVALNDRLDNQCGYTCRTAIWRR